MNEKVCPPVFKVSSIFTVSWCRRGTCDVKSVFPVCLQDTAIVHPVPIRMTPSKIHMQEMELKRTGSGERAAACCRAGLRLGVSGN